MLHLRTIVASAFVTFAIMIGAFGVTAAVRGVQSAATSPLESLKGGTAFDDRLDWNQFANPDSTRLYQIITTKASPDASVEGGRGGPFAPVDPAAALEEDEEITGSVEPVAPQIDIAALIDAQVGSDPGSVLASPRPDMTIDFGIVPTQPIAAAAAPTQARTQAAPRKRVARKRLARAPTPKAKAQPAEPARPANTLQSLFGGNS